jgi:hypothetical protein
VRVLANVAAAALLALGGAACAAGASAEHGERADEPEPTAGEAIRTAGSDDAGMWYPDLQSAALTQARLDRPDARTLTVALVEYPNVGVRLRVTEIDGDLCLIYGSMWDERKGFRANLTGEC